MGSRGGKRWRSRDGLLEPIAMMVERMARAMFPHFWAANMEESRRPKGLERDREAAREKARVALHAMRWPTDAMIDLVADVIDLTQKRGRDRNQVARTAIAALIDQALKEEA